MATETSISIKVNPRRRRMLVRTMPPTLRRDCRCGVPTSSEIKTQLPRLVYSTAKLPQSRIRLADGARVKIGYGPRVAVAACAQQADHGKQCLDFASKPPWATSVVSAELRDSAISPSVSLRLFHWLYCNLNWWKSQAFGDIEMPECHCETYARSRGAGLPDRSCPS
jgi:hypothetical protein